MRTNGEWCRKKNFSQSLFITYRKCTPDKRQSKTLILSTDVDQKSLETEFSIAIYFSLNWRQITIENTVSSDIGPCLSIVKSVFDCRLPGVIF